MFGERLKEIRKMRGYTLEALAETYNKTFHSGLNKGTLSKYENNKQEPMISVVYNLATILNVQTDYLLCKTNSYINNNSTPKLSSDESPYDNPAILFSNNLNYWLDLSGKSRNDLAAFLNASSYEVEKWCNGDKLPKMEIINKIAAFFNIMSSDLVMVRKSVVDDTIISIAEKIVNNKELNSIMNVLLELNREDLKIIYQMAARLKTMIDK